MKGSILVVDDEPDAAELLCDVLRMRDFDATAMTSARECLEHLRTHPTDVVVTDFRMPGMSGIELCATLRERHPEVLPIVITGQGDLATAVAAIDAGTYDFITKPVQLAAIELSVSRALEYLRLKREVRRLRAAGDREPTIDRIAGDSPAIREMVERIRRVAASETSVLITGESGTGKALVARALHDLSPRREQPFVAVNCAAMPASWFERELFGHVRGAFSDAEQDRKGLFVSAGAGTILLDEIGEMPTEMQVKLARALQQRTLRPVGGTEELPFEARVLTSTKRDLDTDVAEQRFRGDLFDRINVARVAVPPLRDRAGDVLSLARHFIDQIARRTQRPVRGLSAAAARLLVDFDWPGNVRELENCMERAAALCRLDEITIDDLPAKVREHESSTSVMVAAAPGELITMEEMERRYVRHVLAAAGGNKTQAAQILGIDRGSLCRRLEQSGAEPPPC